MLTFSDGTDLNSIAKYDCVEGYQPVSGAPLRFCRSDGTWSGEELVCGRGKYISGISIITQSESLRVFILHVFN